MTIVDSDMISVTSRDEKKTTRLDLSESLFDYDLLLSDISANNNSNNIKRENDIFFSDLNSGLFKQEEGTEYNPHPRPKIVQWGPHDGQQATTIISVVLQYHLDTSSEEMLPTMKLGFGSIVVETAHQQHRLGNQSDSIWITLAAQAPLFSDTQCSTTNVPISICLFDSQDPDLAIDHWEIGTFTFREIQIDSENKSNLRKRALSKEPEEEEIKKKPNCEHKPDVNSQLLQLLAPYDPVLAATNSDVDSSVSQQSTSMTPMSTHETTTDVPSDDQVWLNQMQPTSRPAQSYSSPFSEDPSLQPTMMSQQPGMYGVSQPSYMSNMQKQDMYRAFLELQRQRQQQFAAVSMQQQNTMTPTMEHYLAQNHNSNSNNNSSSSNNNSSNDHMLYHANHPRNTNQPYMPLSNQITYQEHSYQPKKSMHQEGMVGGLDGTPSKHSASSSNAPSSSFNISNNNSCALNKAHLKLVGNLMDTIVNWTVSEWQSGRRLVQFWRTTQTDAEGNLTLVECGFNPMDQQQYHQQRMRDNVAAVAAATAAAVAVTSSGPMNVNMNRPTSASPIVISCIYWRERNDYFITSVDCIYLLESLIGIQFTVEEKNRIRRNLEGFRPLTVSKCKIECADFFKLIMSFPHPKPRNIEKDVKVFAWKTLPHALRKIIRKYTPSYITSAPLEPIQTHEPGRSMSTGSLTFAPPTLHDGY